MRRILVTLFLTLVLVAPASAQEDTSADPSSATPVMQPAQSVLSPSIAFDGRLDPGSIPGPPASLIPYQFAIVGLGDDGGLELRDGLELPPIARGWSNLGGQRLAIFVPPDAPTGTYTI